MVKCKVGARDTITAKLLMSYLGLARYIPWSESMRLRKRGVFRIAGSMVVCQYNTDYVVLPSS